MKLKKMLIENPDGFKITDKQRGDKVDVWWTDLDARPFGIFNGKMYVGSYGSYHGEMRDWFDDKSLPAYRFKYDYPGRIWKDDKLISFWVYPPKNEMKKIIKMLEDETNLNIWNKNWRIEVVVDDYGQLPYGKKFYEAGEDSILIPITDYAGSAEQIGKDIDHVISPMKKKKKSVPTTIGSEKSSGDKNIPAKSRFIARKGLGDGVIKLKEILYKIIEGDKNVK